VHWIWSCRGCRTRDVEVSFLCLVYFFCPINSNTWWPVGVGRAARSSFKKPGLFRPKFQKPELARPGPAGGEAARAAPLRPLMAGTYDLLKDFSPGCGGHKDLLLSKEYLEEQWGKPTALRGRSSGSTQRYEFHVSDHTYASFHCELRLVHYLNSRGIFGGFIGVSKLCCEICSVALDGLNKKKTRR